MQFGFMKGKEATYAIFIVRQILENSRITELKEISSILALWIGR